MVIVCYFYQSEYNPLIHEERRPKAQAGLVVDTPNRRMIWPAAPSAGRWLEVLAQ